jgi:hypothetical protein
MAATTQSGLRLGRFGGLALACLLPGGCGTVSPLPALPDIAEALSLNQDEVVGSPTEVYLRVARGAMACWFGSSGPMKLNYVYHAQAQPAAKGGKAEIVIHERDRKNDNQKGLRAFRVQIKPSGDSADVAVENLKLDETLATAMEADVRRWASGALGCKPPAGEWSPETPEAPDEWKILQDQSRAT